MRWSGKNLRPALLDNLSLQSWGSGALDSGRDSAVCSSAQAGCPVILSWVFVHHPKGLDQTFLLDRVAGRIQWDDAFEVTLWWGGGRPESLVLRFDGENFLS